MSRLNKALEGAKKAFGARPRPGSQARRARAERGDALGNSESAAALDREEALIEGSLEVRLGRLDRLRVLTPPPGERASLLPEEAFLLSRVDGIASADEVLDLSPLPRQRTLRLLVRLLRRGLIRNEYQFPARATSRIRDPPDNGSPRQWIPQTMDPPTMDPPDNGSYRRWILQTMDPTDDGSYRRWIPTPIWPRGDLVISLGRRPRRRRLGALREAA